MNDVRCFVPLKANASTVYITVSWKNHASPAVLGNLFRHISWPVPETFHHNMGSLPHSPCISQALWSYFCLPQSSFSVLSDQPVAQNRAPSSSNRTILNLFSYLYLVYLMTQLFRLFLESNDVTDWWITNLEESEKKILWINLRQNCDTCLEGTGENTKWHIQGSRSRVEIWTQYLLNTKQNLSILLTC